MAMYEIIIDKGDCKYKLKVRILAGISYSDFGYQLCGLFALPKRKRKWYKISDEWREDYEYRRTEYDKRNDYIKNKYLEYLTQDDIDNALNQVYEKLSPQKENTNYFL